MISSLLTLLLAAGLGSQRSEVMPVADLAVSRGSKSTTSGALASPRVARGLQSANFMLGPESTELPQWQQDPVQAQSSVAVAMQAAQVC